MSLKMVIQQDSKWLGDVIDLITASDFAYKNFGENVFFSIPCVSKDREFLNVVIGFSDYDPPMSTGAIQKLYAPFSLCKVIYPHSELEFQSISQSQKSEKPSDDVRYLKILEKKTEKVLFKDSPPTISTFADYYRFTRDLGEEILWENLSLILSHDWLNNNAEFEYQKEVAMKIAPHFYKVPNVLNKFYNTHGVLLIQWLITRLG